MQETRAQSLGQEDPLEKEMATHSSILAWESHGQRSLVGYSPWGIKESDMIEHTRTNPHLHLLEPIRILWFFMVSNVLNEE